MLLFECKRRLKMDIDEGQDKYLSIQSADDPDFIELDRDDLRLWLLEKDIPLEFCDVFKVNYIDGKEFLSLKEEEVYKMVPPVGLAKKIIRMLPTKSSVPPTPADSMVVSPDLTPSPSTNKSANHDSSSSSDASSSLFSKESSGGLLVPTHWCTDTQKAINSHKLDPNVRCDIVRTMATLLISKYGPDPPKPETEKFSRQLILKYPFMRDDFGTGYASWYEKILERLRNKRKRPKGTSDCAVHTKKPKQSSSKVLMKRYPPRLNEDLAEDADSVKKHQSAMAAEMGKKKPREIALLPLMKDTYRSRRDFITSDDCSGIEEILNVYPALRLPAAIEQDMVLIFINENDNVKKHFCNQWMRYVTAILTFSDGFVRCLSDLDPSDAYSRESTAMKALFELFKCNKALLFEEIEEEDDIQEFVRKNPERVSPRMIVNKGEVNKKYHIVIEQLVVCEVDLFARCLFILLSSFYVFHLKYPDKCKKVLLFLQDYILEQPDNFQARKGDYLSKASDIKKHLE